MSTGRRRCRIWPTAGRRRRGCSPTWLGKAARTLRPAPLWPASAAVSISIGLTLTEARPEPADSLLRHLDERPEEPIGRVAEWPLHTAAARAAHEIIRAEALARMGLAGEAEQHLQQQIEGRGDTAAQVLLRMSPRSYSGMSAVISRAPCDRLPPLPRCQGPTCLQACGHWHCEILLSREYSMINMRRPSPRHARPLGSPRRCRIAVSKQSPCAKPPSRSADWAAIRRSYRRHWQASGGIGRLPTRDIGLGRLGHRLHATRSSQSGHDRCIARGGRRARTLGQARCS